MVKVAEHRKGNNLIQWRNNCTLRFLAECQMQSLHPCPYVFPSVKGNKLQRLTDMDAEVSQESG